MHDDTEAMPKTETSSALRITMLSCITDLGTTEDGATVASDDGEVCLIEHLKTLLSMSLFQCIKTGCASDEEIAIVMRFCDAYGISTSFEDENFYEDSLEDRAAERREFIDEHQSTIDEFLAARLAPFYIRARKRLIGMMNELADTQDEWNDIYFFTAVANGEKGNRRSITRAFQNRPLNNDCWAQKTTRSITQMGRERNQTI
jgi:hypothetical protein